MRRNIELAIEKSGRAAADLSPLPGAARAGFDGAFMYCQLAAPKSRRKIPFRSLLRRKALVCFRAGRRRISY
jgi:hypothetical protein